MTRVVSCWWGHKASPTISLDHEKIKQFPELRANGFGTEVAGDPATQSRPPIFRPADFVALAKYLDPIHTKPNLLGRSSWIEPSHRHPGAGSVQIGALPPPRGSGRKWAEPRSINVPGVDSVFIGPNDLAFWPCHRRKKTVMPRGAPGTLPAPPPA